MFSSVNWTTWRLHFINQATTSKTCADILSADWFYEKDFTGNRVKSPVELIVSLQRQTGGRFSDPQSLIFFQRALSQQLFYPPNVGGWPKGKHGLTVPASRSG